MGFKLSFESIPPFPSKLNSTYQYDLENVIRVKVKGKCIGTCFIIIVVY